MAEHAAEAAKGQVWRNKRTGAQIVLRQYRKPWDDWTWEGLENSKRRGFIMGYNLPLMYDLEIEGLTPIDIAWERARLEPYVDTRQVFEAGWNAGQAFGIGDKNASDS